ncbi:MAG TPA: matrixin family metalloprotease, partial [Longimicrobium sp.]|nr:matrixin family metalloprotease [Longimicrobium sp.]
GGVPGGEDGLSAAMGAETRRRLELVPVGGVSMEVVSAVRRAVDARFGTRSRVDAPLPLYPEWVDEATGRALSGPVLDALAARAAALAGEDGEPWVLGVAGAELAAPGHPLVFGEALVSGCCAVVGMGAPDEASQRNQTTLLERAAKHAVHEIGHVAGLEHCADPGCVMYPSRDIADTDRKGVELCRRCRARLFSAKA